MHINPTAEKGRHTQKRGQHNQSKSDGHKKEGEVVCGMHLIEIEGAYHSTITISLSEIKFKVLDIRTQLPWAEK